MAWVFHGYGRPALEILGADPSLALVAYFVAALAATLLVFGWRWRFIATAGEMVDYGPLDSMQVPHSKLVPDGDVRDFLTAYACAGGPHHAAVCFGDARRRIRMLAEMLDADCCEV